MPYYASQIVVPVCADDRCWSKATHEVRTPTNELMARYCKPHADRRVEQMNKALSDEIASGRWNR